MNTGTDTSLIAVGDSTSSHARTLGDVLAGAGAEQVAGTAAAGLVAAQVCTDALADAARIGFDWTAHTPVDDDEIVTVRTVITRITGGHVDRHLAVLDEKGRVRESGTETWRLDDPSTADAAPELDICSAEWGRLLADSLEDDRSFTSSLATWDGTIGLRCGDRELHLRIYKGTIIDVTRRTPHGATFTFIAPTHTWVDLVLSEENDFMRRAIGGEFSSAGDGYEYLRLTKPLNTIIAHARDLARKAES